MTRNVLIVGGGLAGLSAAIHLIEAGIRPAIIESNQFVGGRTASWKSANMQVETGLHRYLGFYNHLPQLLESVGLHINDVITWEDEVEIRMPDGPRATFGLSPIHKPFRTITRFLGNNHFLSLRDKWRLQKFFAAGAKDYFKRPDYLDSKTVLEYAREHDVSKAGVQRLLIPLTEGIFFLSIGKYSAYALFGLVMPYLKSLHKLRVGAFSGGMTDVMAQPLADHVTKHGGKVLTGEKVLRVRKAQEKFLVTTDKKTYRPDAVVLATSLGPAQNIVRQSFPAEKWFTSMLRLKNMSSVTFQIELREPCMELDRTTFGPLTAMASFAEQSRTTFRHSKGRLSVILSPVERFINMDPNRILDIVVQDAARLGVDIHDKVIDCRKIVIPHDFYELSPRQNKLRPLQKTSIPGLFLAGDYTRQKYLATMEGAVFSGKRAAKLVDAYLGGGLL